MKAKISNGIFIVAQNKQNKLFYINCSVREFLNDWYSDDGRFSLDDDDIILFASVRGEPLIFPKTLSAKDFVQVILKLTICKHSENGICKFYDGFLCDGVYEIAKDCSVCEEK